MLVAEVTMSGVFSLEAAVGTGDYMTNEYSTMGTF